MPSQIQIVKHEELKEIIKRVWRTHKYPIMIWGKVGIGKTFTVEQATKELALETNREWTDVSENWNKEPTRYFGYLNFRVSQVEPPDIRGLPYKTDNGMEWIPPSCYPKHKSSMGIMFFDEVNRGCKEVLSPLFQLKDSRRIGDYILPDGWSIVLAGNKREHGADVIELDFPDRNRMLQYELEATVEDWIIWASAYNLDNRIISYIAWKRDPKVLFGDSEREVSPTCRMWHWVSNLIKGVEDMDYIRLIVAGGVGSDYANDFMAYLQYFHKLKPLELLFKDWKSYPIYQEATLKYAIPLQLLAYWREHDYKPKMLETIFRYLAQYEDEILVFAWKIFKATNREVVLKAFNKNKYLYDEVWYKRLRKYW